MALTEISANKCFGGCQKVFSFASDELKCETAFGVYLPSRANTSKCPVLYFLSGLTCTEANFVQKSGFQRYAEQHGIIVVNPDTSPRGCSIEGEDDSYDFGSGAGFYVDATESKWAKHYRMYSYVTKELSALVKANFPVTDKQAITGHSMGGHGALVCALKNPGQYASASAFAPISNPVDCPWGKKAFAGYLGGDQSTWTAYDASHLLKGYSGPKLDILVDQGDKDQFLVEQLKPEALSAAAKGNSATSLDVRMQPGYDHSYFFISTFIGDHIAHHAKHLA